MLAVGLAVLITKPLS